MLCSVEDLLSKDNLKSAMVLAVLQFHFRLNAYCHILYIIYYTQCVSIMLCKAPIRKKKLLCKPLLSVNNTNVY